MLTIFCIATGIYDGLFVYYSGETAALQSNHSVSKVYFRGQAFPVGR